jgi:hypothetical protein
MPKTKLNLKIKLNNFLKQFGDIFSTDGKILYCQLCTKEVNSTKKYYVEQHIKSQTHVLAAKRKTQPIKQQFIEKSILKSDYNYDLCEALIAADIPLFKLKNEKFKNFLEKYTKNKTPDDSTLKKSYTKEVLNNVNIIK